MNYERLFAKVINYILYLIKYKERKLQRYENTIKIHIRNAGLLQNWVAAQLEVHETEFSRWVSGSRKPNSKQLTKLCRILSTSRQTLYPNGTYQKRFKIQ